MFSLSQLPGSYRRLEQELQSGLSQSKVVQSLSSDAVFWGCGAFSQELKENLMARNEGHACAVSSHT